MRPAVRELAERTGLVLSDDQPQEIVDWVVKLTDSFESNASNDEALALLELLSRSDDLFYEVSWTILHFIETAPDWPIWPELLKTNGKWARILELRSKNAGLMPPGAAAEKE